jgi:hypothetical protein
MILADKGYFDYDFERFGMVEEGKDWTETVRSDDEIDGIMKGFGFGKRVPKEKKPDTTEEIQEYIIKHMEE